MVMQCEETMKNEYQFKLLPKGPPQQNTKKRSLWLRTMLGVMVAGTALPGLTQPVFATDITAAAGFTGTRVSNPSGPVVTVTTDKVINKGSSNSTAVNVFDKYSLSKNDIANMYFGSQDNNGNQNLVNFVRNRVDINGVVNAVQNNKIGGKLYFLSSNGIAVSSSGVINAGSVMLMTPTQQYMDNLVGAAGSNVPAAMANTINDGTVLNIVNPDTMAAIPLNPAGTISVDGIIHATDGITLRTGHEIKIGTAADTVAKLETGVLDFGSFVNTSTASAGLGSTLKATKSGSGDIVLTASTSEKNTHDASFHQSFIQAIGLSDENTIETKVIQNSGTISAVGNVRVTAESTNNDERVARTVATVDITGGTIQGAHVAVKADAKNTFSDNGSLDTVVDVPLEILGAATVNFDADYALLDSQAAVNIGSKAVLTATGENTTDAAGNIIEKAMDIQANSLLGSKMGAATTPFKFADIKFSNIAPAAAVTYFDGSNNASVQIDGTLKTTKAAGDASVAATATTEIAADASTTTTTLAGNPSLFNAALLVLHASNTANVNIGSAAQLQGDNLKGKLDISSTANNGLTATVSTKGSDSSAAASAVNITTYDSSSAVDVASGVKAADVTINANNNVIRNTVMTTNAIGATALVKTVTNKLTNSKTFGSLFDTSSGSTSLANHIINLLPTKLATIINTPADKNSLGEQAAQLGKMISVGVGLQYVDESNTSQVKVHAVPVTANSVDVSIKAKTDVQDTRMVVAGAANNQQDNSQVQYTADGAVLIAGMNNTSQVVIDGGTTASHAAITGKNVTISADTQMPYNRVNKLIEGVTDAVAAVKEAYKESNISSSSEYIAALDAIDEAGKAIISKGDSFSDTLSNAGTALSNFSSAVGSLLNIVGDDTSTIGDTVAAPIAVLKNVAQFTSTDQYANFYVRTVASEGQADQDSKLALAGSVSVTDVTNDSRVLIGKNAVVTATDALKTTAVTKAENMSFTGNVSALLLPGSANATGAGASVAVQRFSSDSLVLAAEGAKLTGAAVDVEANTTLTPTGVVLSAGTAGENGLSGMVNIMSGSGSAIASVDDEAVLTAKKASAGTITEKQNDGSVTIKATNDTTLTNVSGGFMKASGTSVGVGVAVNNYSVNTIAGVFDNDADAKVTEDTAAATVTAKAANKKKAASKLALSMSGLDDTAKAALLGSSSTMADGLLTGQSVAADATTSGVINSAGIAGAVSTSDDSGEEGVGDKIGKFVSGISDKITTPIGNGMTKVDGYMSGNLNSHGFSPAKLANSGSSNQKEADAKANSLSNSSSPKANIAGGVAINLLDGQSSAMLDQTKVTLQPDPGDKTSGTLTTKATDTLFSGAWAGTAAVNWATTTKAENSSTSAGVSGAAAVNVIDRDVDSIISNSTIKNAGSIINSASKDGAEVAAALGMTLSKSTGSEAGANVAVAAAVSYNNIDSDVHALMIDDSVSTDNGAVTALQNDAYNGDIQVTGGVNAALSFGGQSGAGVGASVVIGTITDDVQSVISGGTYTQMGNVDVTSALATKQIGVGVGVAASSSSNSGTFEGVVAYNAVSNTANAAIDGASITTAGNQTVTVKTYDTNSLANSHAQYIKDRGLDADGASYEAALDNGHKYTDDEKDQNYNKAVADSAAKTDEDGGNVIVTGALSVSGSSGKAAIGAGVAIDEITNDFTSNITNSTITAGAVKGTADADTVLVGFSVGAAGSSNFGGAGSVSWQDLDSSAVTTVTDSAITANKADFTATNDTVGVNVAGQVSAGKVATGLAMAYHGLDNTTGAYVYGSDLKARDASDGIAVTLDAESTARIYSVGVGVGVSTSTVAVNGVVTMNRGSNTTEAVIDSDSKDKRTTITAANDVKTTAKDDTVTVAIAGGVTAGSGSAVGGAVAINDIGGFSNDGTKSSQNIKSQINHTDIKSFTPVIGAADQINLISTDASDNAHMITVGAGIGASSQVAVQGAAASSLINKNVVSGLDDTNIDASTVDASTAKISTTAANEAHVVASAVVIAGSGTAAIGAGVGVNRIVQNTEASVTGGTQHVANASLNSTSNPDILAIGVGGAGAGTVSVAGSFGINMIQNDTKALISGATMVSQQNIGVVAQSDEYIDNIVGAVSGSGTAAIGLSTAVNTINGTTAAIVDNSDLTAKGSDEDAIATDSDMKDGSVLTSFVDKGAFVPGTLKAGRQSASKTGLAVDSSSTHSILSTVFSAGGSGVVAVLGTANVNDIGGATTAQILNSNVNKDLTATDKADVTVKAADYTNEAGFTGTAGGSGTATVGAASDTNILERTVRASVENDKKNTAIQKNMIHASDFTVDAVAQQGLSSFDTGVGIAGEGAAVVGNVSVAKLNGTTAALVDNSDITSDSTRVAADHKANIFVGGVNVSGAAIGAAVGAAVAVTNSTGTTSAEMKDSTDVSTGDVTVKAEDKTILNTIMTSGAISGAGVSVLGNTSVNNIHNIVTAKTTDSTITGKDVLVQADNSVQTENIGGVLSVGGLGGAGVSVSVNTFDSTVGAVVSGGSLTASDGDVTVKANDTRDVDQTVMNVAGGAVGASANIMVTTAGKAVEDSDADNDAVDKILQANQQGNASNASQQNVLGLDQTEQTKLAATRTVVAGVGGAVPDAGIHAKVDGSTLQAAQGTVSVATAEKNDIVMTGGSIAAGGASLNASVGILDLHHNADTDVSNSVVTARAVSLTSDLADLKVGSQMDIYQGSGAVFALGAAYGKVRVDGGSAVSIKDSNLTATMGDMTAKAADTSTENINAYGLSIGGITAGAIIVDSQNDSTTAVDVESTKAESLQAAQGKVVLAAEKANTVKAYSFGGAVGVATGIGLQATSSDNGTAVVNLRGSSYTLLGQSVAATAQNTSHADVQALNVAAGADAVQVTQATAVENAGAGVGIADGNTIQADKVGFTAQVGKSGETTANAKIRGVSVGAAGFGIGVNTAEADTATHVAVNVGNENYAGTDGTLGAAEVTISGQSNVTQKTDASGLTVGLFVASGNNFAAANSKNTMAVNANGGVVKTLSVSANGNTYSDSYANGDGGGITTIQAASADNVTDNTTTATINGSWNIAGKLTATAIQTDRSNVRAEGINGGVIPISSGQTTNTINGMTKAAIGSGAVIQAADAAVKAENSIMTDKDIDPDKDFGYAVNAEIYGVAGGGNATAAMNIDKRALIDVGQNAAIQTTGTQVYEADTVTDLTNKVRIVAAGGVGVPVGASNNTLALTDQIDIGSGAFITNLGTFENGGVTLSAHDTTKLTATADADIPGAATGVATAASNNTITRNNLINVNGTLSSSKDLNLYAGAAVNGSSAVMNLYLGAAAYNHTALPIATKPSITTNVSENNHVIVGASGAGDAVRHINMAADGGKDSILKETNIFSWVGGGSSTEVSYVGNAEGVSSYGQKTDNYVQVDGSLTAGTKHQISIDIDGVVVPEDSYKAGTTSSGTYTIDTGGDAELAKRITTGSTDYGNDLFARWKTLNTLIEAYKGKVVDTSNDLAAYTGYVQELARLEKEMDAKGLREKIDYTDPSTGQTYTVYVPIEGYVVNYISLPDLAASGGDINVHSGSLKGSGILTANGSPSVNITNTSSAYLKMGNITIGDAGGKFVLNGTSITDGGNTAINNLNTNKDYKANFSSIHTDIASGEAAAVKIENSYTGGAVAVNANPDRLRQSIKDGLTTTYTQEKEAQLFDAKLAEVWSDKRNAIRDAELTATQKQLVVTDQNAILDGIIQNNETYLTDIYDAIDTYMESDAVAAAVAAYVKAQDIETQVQSQFNSTYYAADGQTPAVKNYTPISTVEIGGMIDNPHGIVSVTNKSGDILIAPQSSDAAAGVNAKEVHMTASGSITQGYVDGILNIGSAPEYVYSSYTDQMIKNSAAYLYPDQASHGIWSSNSLGSNTDNNVRIAGGSIYLNASDINVNGTIQSGYSKYYANIGNTDLTEEKLQSYANDASRQATINHDLVYRVNDGGKAVVQSDGTYAYEVQVYYNPKTGNLLVEDIDTQGGKVYLSGRISSTGRGKIIAVDGGADISIVNGSEATLNVGKVFNNDIQGLISITDTNLNKQVQYTNTGTTTIDNYSSYLSDANAANVTTSETSSLYQPQTGLRYNWTQGTASVTKRTYQNDVRKGLWGAVETRNETALQNYENISTPMDIITVAGEAKPKGAFISTLTEAKDIYTLIADSTVTNKSRSPIKQWMTKSGFLGWFHTTHYRWTVTSGSSQSYVSSVKADNPIAIKFIGQPDGNIEMNSAGNINLTGNIANNSAAATLSVQSLAGSVAQKKGTTIKDSYVRLSAQTGITGIDITSLGQDTVYLYGHTNTGNIDVNVSGGIQDNKVLAGNVALASLKSDNDASQVALTATGDITQQDAMLSVQGGRIDLVSTNGAIGTAEQALIVQAGQNANGTNPLSASVNASAQGDIRLKQDSGDMRVGRVESNSGDVILTASGALIDALPTGETTNNVDTLALIQRWKDAGLIAGDGVYKQKLEQDVLDYENIVKTNYNEYITLKNFYTNNPKVQRAAAYAELEAMFSSYSSAQAYLDAQKTIASSDYASLLVKRDHPTYEWTQDQLLYAIKSAVINKETGSTDTENKQANVSGKNVTLLANNIGVDKADKKTISLIGLTNTDDPVVLANLKLLANSEAADITWDEANKVAIIGGKVPLGVNATGLLNVTSTGNVYLAGRSDSKDQYAPLNVGTIISSDSGDIRLLGKAGVYNALTTGTNFSGNDLIVEGGAADIGASDKYVTVDLTGGLAARTDGNIYIASVNPTTDLKINALYAKDSINLASDRSIIMDPAADAQAYVSSGTVLNLTADADGDGIGDIGTEGTAVRVNDNGVAVNAAGNNVYLSGKNDGTLVLGVIQAKSGTVQVDSEGTLGVGKAAVTDGTGTVTEAAVTGSISAKTVSALTAAKDINLTGPVTIGTAGGGQSLSLLAKAGAVTQTQPQDTNQAIQADVLNVTSLKGQDLQNTGNAFSTFNMDGVTNHTVNGDVDVKTNAPQGLTANLNNSLVMGNVNITNLAQGSTAGIAVEGGVTTIDNTAAPGAAGGNVSVAAAGTVVNNGEITSIGNVLFQSTAADVTNNKFIHATKSLRLLAKNGVSNGAELTGAQDIEDEEIKMTADTGDITNYGTVTSTKGIISMTASEGNINNQKAVTSATEVVMTAKQAITNGGTVTAQDGQVDMTANTGNIANTGAVTANKGLVSMTAAAGAIDNQATVSAKGDVDLTAHTDISNTGSVESTDGHVNMTAETGKITSGGTVTGNGDVAMQAQTDITNSGAVTSQQGMVDMAAKTGKITNGQDVTAATDVIMDAGNGIDNSGSVTAAAGNVGMTTKNGNIANTGDVQAGTSVMMEDGTGNIINSGAVTANNGPVGMTAAAGAIDNQATVSAKGDVDLTAHTDISNTGSVESTGGHVDMTAETGKITSGGTVTGNGDVAMQAQTDITNSGAVTSQQGMVDMAAKTGKITNGQDVTAATDVIMDAEKGIDNSGSVTATARKLSMTVKNGNIANTGDVQAGTSVTMEDGTGNILNNGNVNAGTEAKLQTTTGDIINKGKLLAGTDVTVTTDNGKVQNLGDVTAATGNVLLKAKTGRVEVGSAAGDATVTAGNTATLATDSTTKSDIEIYGDIVGTNGISLTTNVGDIIWHGRGTAAQGPVQVTTNTGNINHTGAIAAGTDVLQQTQEGNIANGGTIDAGGNVTQQTQEGNIANGGTIDAGSNVTQQTQTGSITDAGDIQAGNDALLQTGSGDIGINGNIRANRNVTIHADSGNITAAEGTTIAAASGNAAVSSGQGDITLHELQALKEAGVDANDGNVKVFRIEGEDILIAVRNTEKSADIGSISMKNKLTFIGQSLDLGELIQHPGMTTMLELSPRGADTTLPMNHVNIGDVITPNGLHVDQLWAQNSDIHVSSPKFYIDKLGILDVAHLSNSDTNTTVWGSAPVRDDANTIYWYGPQRHDPWMNLYFTDRQHTQFSNGVLLRYDDYYYAKNDRFSGVNTAFKREDRSEHAYRQLEDFCGEAMPGFLYGLYDRYGLFDVDQDIVTETPKADIVIEQ